MKLKINFFLFFNLVASFVFSQTNNLPQQNGSFSFAGKSSVQNVFNGNETIATSYTHSACGLNYVQVSKALHGRSGNNYTLNPVQISTLTISGIPACAIIERAFLYVGTTGTGTPVSANITNPVSGNSIFSMMLIGNGSDKNWGRVGSYTHRANVTSIISGNGNYVISGIPSSSVLTDDDSNGATLLVIYSDRTQNYTGSIVIADGSMTNANAAGTLSASINGFSVCGTPTLSHAFMIVDDLQQYGPTNFSVNSATVNYSQAAVSDMPWSFLTNSLNPVISGQTNAEFAATNTLDTLGLLLGGLYYQSDCLNCPVTLTLNAITTASCLSTASVTIDGGVAPFTYTWSGSAQTGSAVTGLSAGTETVYVSDQLGCLSGSATLAITNPAPPITLNASSVCVGYGVILNAGAASSYSWSPSGSLNADNTQNVIASPLVTTIYTLDYVNALGCIGSQTTEVLVTYTQNITVGNVTLCAGQNLNLSANSFTGNAYFWTGPNAYTYSSTVQSDPVLANSTTLMTGPYNLSVTSVPGCTSMATSNVNVFPLPTPSLATNAPICAGFNLTFAGSGGSAYSWTGPNGYSSVQQNPTIANSGTLATGVYSALVSFATGCSQTSTIFAQVRALPDASCAITSSNVCLGRDINFGATGGISYVWSGPNGFASNLQNPSILGITLLTNGVYTVTVTDATGCQANATTTLAALFNPTVALACPVTCMGSIATITANGFGFYTFYGPNGFVDINPVNNLTGFSTTTVIASNLSAGVYSIQLQSALNTCSAQATGVLATIPVPTVIATSSAVCYNAVATLTAAGGLANGSGYSWTGPQGYTSTNQYAFVPVANNLTSGVYTVVGTAPNSCTSQAVTTLTTIPLPTVTATGTLICLNEPFTFTASGAVSYTWAGPSAYTAIGANAFVTTTNDFSIGDYTVVGTGVNTCTQVTTANLAYMPLPTITTLPDNVCLNEPATLQANGLMVASYRWDGPASYTSVSQNAAILSAISPAPLIYTVVGTAPNTCTQVATAMLSTIPLPTVVATGTVICYKEPYIIPAAGANTYSWTGPSNYAYIGQNALIQSVDETSEGVYRVVGTNAVTGCTNVTTATLTTMPLPTITAVPNTTVCYLTPAILKAQGGISSGYRWTGPNGFTSLYQNAYVSAANSALPQTYTVVGTAANTCTNVTTHTLYTWPLPIPTYTATERVCFRSNIELKGDGALTYTWTGPYYFESPNRDVWFPTYDMRQAGTYTLSVIDSLGCKNFTTLAVNIDPLPVGKLVSNNVDNFCAPYCSKFWLHYNSDASLITKTVWTIKSQTVEGNSFNYCAEKAGLHSVIGSFTNAVGCINTQSLPIIANPRPEADFYFQPYKAIETVDIVSFNDLSKGDSLQSWNWYFADNLNYLSKEKNTSYVFSEAGLQPIAMVVSNYWGCSDTIVKTIQVREDVHLYVPDAFTPNGDGLNDIFIPRGRGIQKYHLAIYNRWGDRVFESNDIAKGWDGIAGRNGSSDEVFVWRIIYTDVNFSVNEKMGQVTLTR